MTKVLVLGSSGLIGHMVYRRLATLPDFDVAGTHNKTRPPWPSTRLNVISDFQRLAVLVEDTRPEIVINCIGMLIRESTRNVSDAVYVNALFPHKIKKILNTLGCKLIQISTDCVFSGEKADSRPYDESDVCNGTTVYSKTKALGEIVDDFNLTIRTSVIGPELKPSREELFSWFVSHRQSKVNGYTNAFWSGVTSLELASVIPQLISQGATGLVHVCSPKPITKYDLLKLIAESLALNVELHPSSGYRNDKSMVSNRLDFVYTPPDYPIMVRRMVENIMENNAMYEHYDFHGHAR